MQQGADAVANAAVRLAPKDPLVWSNRSRMRLLLNDARGALEDAERSLALAPGDNANARSMTPVPSASMARTSVDSEPRRMW